MKRGKLLTAAGILVFAAVCLAGCIRKVPDDNIPGPDRKETAPSESVTAESDKRLNEAPDYITDRGIILRGENVKVDDTHSYRKSSDNGTHWFYDYNCDCNLSVESTEDEFSHFLERFSGVRDVTVYYEVSKMATVYYQCGKTSFQFDILRTDSGHPDLTGGRIYVEDDPGYAMPIYYSNDGKYYLCEYGDISDDLLLIFLEPVMVKADIRFNGADSEPVSSFEDAATIDKIIDTMHMLEAQATEKDADELLSGEGIFSISFTDDAGKTYDYFIAEDRYLIYNGKVYELSGTDIVDRLLRSTGYWKSKDEPVSEEELELRQFLDLKGPFYYSSLVFFDVTGDGVDDYCTTVSGGSGWFRSYVVIYDPVSKTGYSLSDQHYDYIVGNQEDSSSEKLVICRLKGINFEGTVHSSRTEGTVEFVDGELQFVPEE